MNVCPTCGSPLPPPSRGRAPRYCTSACRQRAYRARTRPAFPASLAAEPRWARRAGDRPILADGKSVSTHDPADWSPLADVQAWPGGYGLMLGAGLTGWTFPQCLTGDQIAGWAAAIVRAAFDGGHALWLERASTSLHMVVFVPGAADWCWPGVAIRSTGYLPLTGHRFTRAPDPRPAPNPGTREPHRREADGR